VPGKAQSGWEVILQPIHYLKVEGDGWSAARSGHFTPGCIHVSYTRVGEGEGKSDKIFGYLAAGLHWWQSARQEEKQARDET